MATKPSKLTREKLIDLLNKYSPREEKKTSVR